MKETGTRNKRLEAIVRMRFGGKERGEARTASALHEANVANVWISSTPELLRRLDNRSLTRKVFLETYRWS